MSSKAVTVLECESSSRPHSLEGTTDDERKPLLYSDPVESSDLGLLNWNCHCTGYFVFLCYFKPIIITQNQLRAKKKEWQLNTDPKAKKLLKAVFFEWSLLHLMRKIKFLAFYVCCFCSHGLINSRTKGIKQIFWCRLRCCCCCCFIFSVLICCPFLFTPLNLLVKIMLLIPSFFLGS